jgi:hypothetical protein
LELGELNQPWTVEVISIKINVFTLDAEIAMGCPPVADKLLPGGGVLYLSEVSDHAGVADKLYTSNWPGVATASTYRRSVAFFMVVPVGTPARLNFR